MICQLKMTFHFDSFVLELANWGKMGCRDIFMFFSGQIKPFVKVPMKTSTKESRHFVCVWINGNETLKIQFMGQL